MIQKSQIAHWEKI